MALDKFFGFYDEKPVDPTSFKAIRIGLASPEKIRSWSFGEVKVKSLMMLNGIDLAELKILAYKNKLKSVSPVLSQEFRPSLTKRASFILIMWMLVV